MRSVNKVILVGNVTRDPDVRQTQNGQTIVTFGLATNRQWKNASGDKQDQAEFHELVAWSRIADLCSKFVKKGKLLYIEGYLKTRSWDTPDGTRRFKTEVVVQDLIMLERKGEGSDEYIPSDEIPVLNDELQEDTIKTDNPVEQATVKSTPETKQVAETPKTSETPEAPVATIAADPNEDFSF